MCRQMAYVVKPPTTIPLAGPALWQEDEPDRTNDKDVPPPRAIDRVGTAQDPLRYLDDPLAVQDL